ncbi:MAG: DegT/DnrJ/EryC1/StrS aminotransferase family protein [Bacteroidales bacterium]|nr:DegT/DnrJ/EryC1/StrS aminotransferase family protein [Bacteroidales bacterium]MCF8404281.1 DegT/DnrJ/EryC1/StrS aminotransferase family protein [Bacteroidales bacterium]
MIPFSPPRMDQKIIDEVVDTLKSGWITTGPKVKRFEEKLTTYGGQKTTLCVSSGSAGLELMLRWFGITEGDEVIVPAYTYAATANVVIHCGARVVFVDCKEDFNIDPEKVKAAITKNTKAIIPVDLAGFPCDYDELNALVKDPEIIALFDAQTEEQKKLGRILILSDAAHSVGAEYKGKKTGSLTDITVYSFHAVKNLTTAEGGAICLNLPGPFNNQEVYQYLRIKSLHGQSKDAFSKVQIGGWKYDVVEPGYKFNMTDIAAAMGLVELERYDDDNLVRRKQIFDAYARAFSKFNWAEIPTYETQEKKSSYHVFLLRIKNIDERQRDAIIQKIYEKGVAVNVHFIPLPLMTYYKNNGYKIDDYPVSLCNYSRVISLPVYYDLTDENVRTVIKAVVESVESK